MRNAGRLLLPIGTTNYKKICDNYYYVDKTLMIKDILDEGTEISLFTRPRRFGKTLNMDMLRTFFEKQEEDTSRYFTDKKIWQQGEAYTKHQGKYPVIYLSLKDANKLTWSDLYARLIETIRDEFFRHSELNNSPKISNPEFYKKIIAGQATEAEYSISILRLSRMLREHYGQSVILIIDEYDTPIQAGYINGFYNEAIQFIRDLFSSALKDNDNLAFGFLTGILRVAKESIFSGLNNIYVYSVLDDKFSDYFGFTDMEVKQLVHYYALDDKLAEIKEWYDGYRFGEVEIYNPWSVLSYLKNGCRAIPYWVQTSSNSTINTILRNLDGETYQKLKDIINGKAISSIVSTNVIYPELKDRSANIFGFLLMTGYLKSSRTNFTMRGNILCELCIPNKEIENVYYNEILSQLADGVSINTTNVLSEALLHKDDVLLKQSLNKFLLETISFYDTLNENYYHGLLLGMTVIFAHDYYIYSNRESGLGRYDIMLVPKQAGLPGIVIEVKATDKSSPAALNALASGALEQINTNKYDTELVKHGVKLIYKYGIAFSGKQAEIMTN